MILAACALLGACREAGRGDEMVSPDAGDVANVDAGGPTMVVATVNLRCLLDGWDARLPRLVQEIEATGADLIALQEVCEDPGVRDALPEIEAALEASSGLSYQSVRAVTHQALDQYQEGIAILSPHPLFAAQTLELPAGIFPRKALLVRIELEGREIQFGATHLSFGDQGQVREAQLASLRDALEARGGADALRLIAGDLNEGPQGTAVSAAVDAGYSDSWAHLHPFNDGPTFPSDAPRSRIDYILAKGRGVPGGILDVRRFLTEASEGLYPSDHLAVWARLSLGSPL